MTSDSTLPTGWLITPHRCGNCQVYYARDDKEFHAHVTKCARSDIDFQDILTKAVCVRSECQPVGDPVAVPKYRNKWLCLKCGAPHWASSQAIAAKKAAKHCDTCKADTNSNASKEMKSYLTHCADWEQSSRAAAARAGVAAEREAQTQDAKDRKRRHNEGPRNEKRRAKRSAAASKKRAAADNGDLDHDESDREELPDGYSPRDYGFSPRYYGESSRSPNQFVNGSDDREETFSRDYISNEANDSAKRRRLQSPSTAESDDREGNLFEPSSFLEGGDDDL